MGVPITHKRENQAMRRERMPVGLGSLGITVGGRGGRGGFIGGRGFSSLSIRPFNSFYPYGYYNYYPVVPYYTGYTADAYGTLPRAVTVQLAAATAAGLAKGQSMTVTGVDEYGRAVNVSLVVQPPATVQPPVSGVGYYQQPTQYQAPQYSGENY